MTVVSPVPLEEEPCTQSVATLVSSPSPVTAGTGLESTAVVEDASVATRADPGATGTGDREPGGTTATEMRTPPEVTKKPPPRGRIIDLSLPDATEPITPKIDFIRATQRSNVFWDHVWVINGEHWRCCSVVYAKGSEGHLNVSSRDTAVVRRVTHCQGDVGKKEDDPSLRLALQRINQDEIACCERLGTIDPAITLPALLEAWNLPGARESHADTRSDKWIQQNVYLCAYEMLLQPSFPYSRASLSLRTLRLSTRMMRSVRRSTLTGNLTMRSVRKFACLAGTCGDVRWRTLRYAPTTPWGTADMCCSWMPMLIGVGLKSIHLSVFTPTPRVRLVPWACSVRVRGRTPRTECSWVV